MLRPETEAALEQDAAGLATLAAKDAHLNPDGTFRGGFDGCVAWAKDTKGLGEDRARALCAYIGRKAGKIGSRVLALSSSGLALAERIAGARAFRKDVLRPGAWHLSDGTVFEVDAARLARIAAATNAWIAAGNKVPFPEHHDGRATEVLGYWRDFAVERDALMGIVDVPDEAVAERVGKTIRDVSIGCAEDAKDGTGRAFGDVLVHVAATPYPVVPGQGNFVELSGERRVIVAAREDRRMEMDPKAMTAMMTAMATALGLPAEADPTAILEAVKGLVEKQAADADAEAARKKAPGAGHSGHTMDTAPAAPPPVSPREAELAKRLEALEVERAAERKAVFEANVSAAMERALKAGQPIDGDITSRARALFAAGRGDDGLAMIGLAAKRSEEVRLARDGQLNVLVRVDESKALEASKQRVAELVDSLRQLGKPCHASADGLSVVHGAPTGAQ